MNKNYKVRMLEACRVAAKKLKSSFEVHSDAVSFCKNTPDDIIKVLELLKPSFNKDAWDHTIFVSTIIKYMPSQNRSPMLCSHDFYRAFKRAHYFSAESAIVRIQKFGKLKVTPSTRHRANLKGVYKNCHNSTLWFVNEINHGWKQFLALGARLCQDDKRSLYWKNWRLCRKTPVKAVVVNNTEFDIHIQGLAPEITRTQVEYFLAYCGLDIFAKVVRPTENCYRITITKEAGTPITAVTPKSEDPFRLEGPNGNPLFVMLKDTNDIEPKVTLVEEHIANQIQPYVTEISSYIDEMDAQIDVLVAKRDKYVAQRLKLTQAYAVLSK